MLAGDIISPHKNNLQLIILFLELNLLKNLKINHELESEEQ